MARPVYLILLFPATLCIEVRVEQMGESIISKIQKMEEVAVTQKDYEEEIALINKEREDLRKKVETAEDSSSHLEVCT